jgi:hypothetical protein
MELKVHDPSDKAWNITQCNMCEKRAKNKCNYICIRLSVRSHGSQMGLEVKNLVYQVVSVLIYIAILTIHDFNSGNDDDLRPHGKC